MDSTSNRIIFYDGICGFCNQSVQFILTRRRDDTLRFSTLQSDFAQTKLAEANIRIEMDTIYFYENGKVYDRSTAALRISKYLRFPFNLLFGLIIIPKFIRDFCYKIIAKNRHKIKSGYCMVPDQDEKKMFIN